MTRPAYRNGLYLDQSFRRPLRQAQPHFGGRMLFAFLVGVTIGVAAIGVACGLVILGAAVLQRIGVL